MSNYARMLTKLLGKPGANKPLRPDQLHCASKEGAETIHGCIHMAQLLFMVIRENQGDGIARRIFAKWGKPPSDSTLQEIANLGLLTRLDLMKPKPNVQRLARQLAEENKRLPRTKQRGAGSTNPIALEKQIRRIRDFRIAHMEKGTWSGPFPD
jgi:hypothetical protein